MAKIIKESKTNQPTNKPKGKNSKGDKNLKGPGKSLTPYLEDSLYTEFMQAYQSGNWIDSEEKLERLIEDYPLDNGLRYLRQDLLLRSNVDGVEAIDIKEDRKIFIKMLVLRIIGSAAVIALLVVGYTYSSTWLQERIAIAEQTVLELAQENSLNAKYADAQAFIQAERYSEALTLLKEINSDEPDYQNLTEVLIEAEALLAIDISYEDAMDLISQGDGIAALEILTEIAVDTPFFKDIDAQIGDLEREYLLGEVLDDANAAFQEERWIDAINNYERALQIEPDLDALGVEDQLFDSYIFGAEVLLTSENLDLSDLALAEAYFRNSLSLRPQNRDALERRANVSDSIPGLLATGYIQEAQKALIEQGDSIKALATASDYFGKALSLNPDAALIRLQYNMARRYLTAESAFRNGQWSSAILDLEFVVSSDRSYAEETAEQVLYEAYGARGNEFLSVGNFAAALEDFRRAVTIALGDEDATLRLFEAQINLAYALGRSGDHKNSVNFYQKAIDESNFKGQLTEDNEEVASALVEGERAEARRDYRSAFIWYSDALRGNTDVYTLFRYTVEDGEYLSQLARRFNSTVQTIVEANNLTYPYYILPGQILLIPTIK